MTFLVIRLWVWTFLVIILKNNYCMYMWEKLVGMIGKAVIAILDESHPLGLG